MTAFFGSQAWVSYQYFSVLVAAWCRQPVEPAGHVLSTTPVAKAWLSSAAWMVTGCAPTSSAMRAVAGL
jgi:hypothetical protein